MLLKFAMQDFIDDREFKNLAPTTIQAYEDTFKQFEEFCIDKESVVELHDVTTSTIKRYIVWLRNERANKSVTTNSKLKHLRAFFNYCIQCEYIKSNPAVKVQKAKEDIKIEVFKDNHVRQMLLYYRRIKQREKSFYAFRDHTLIIFLLGTGVRLGEMCNLKWSDVDFENNEISVFGKARVKQSLPVTMKVMRELASYRIYCENKFVQLSDYVFVNSYNKRLTENAVQNVFKRLAKIMDFKDVRLSAHTFRHTYAHRCLMSGMDVFTLKKLMRHSNLQTTEKYLALWGEDLSELNDKFNPLNNFDL